MFGRNQNLPYSLDGDIKNETTEERMNRIRKIQEEVMHRRRNDQMTKLKHSKTG